MPIVIFIVFQLVAPVFASVRAGGGGDFAMVNLPNGQNFPCSGCAVLVDE